MVTSQAEVYGDYEYTVLDDGTVGIAKYTGSDTEVTIPSKIDGKSVTSIGEYAFGWCESLTSITIPNSVTSIGSSAFRGCKNLTSITIPNSVTSIDEDAFQWCTSLASINVDSGNVYYSSLNGVLYNKDKTELIRSPEGIKSITIPDSVTSIGWGAFYNCESLTSITIPNSVTSIGDYAFIDCKSLKNVTIPNSVTRIGGGAFYRCKSLTSITISNSVTSIGEYAFGWCESLTSITIPNSVTSIGGRAFADCTSLKNIVIPESVTDIGDNAFYDCDDLTIKCYEDSAAYDYAIDNDIAYELLDDHIHSYTSEITKAATCKTTGIRTYTCVDCDDSYTEVIPKTAHKYTAKVVKPTYDAQGYTLHTCSVCGDSYKDTYTAKLTRTSITKATVTGITAKTYTGKALKPAPVVKVNGKKLKSGTDYTVTYKNNTKVGKATVTIKGKGNYTGTVTKTFKINLKATSVSKLTSPKTKQLKAKYKKVSGVTGYQVTYSTSSKFTKSKTKTVTVKGAAKTSKTIKKLTKGKKYYVKVRSYKTVGKIKYYSAYSKVKSIKVK